MASMSISKTISDATASVKESMKSAINMAGNIGGGGSKDLSSTHYTGEEKMHES